MEYNHHWNTSRTRLCSSYPNKNPGKTYNQYWISVWNYMKKPFPNGNLSFSSLIKLLSLKLCVPASYIVHPQERFVYNFWSFINMHRKEIRLIFQRGPICHMHTKRKALLLSYFTLFSEEQLYKNFMYKLTTSVPSFQNDYPFYNNFWLMFWNCNAYFYAFTFKANQHPASFFFFFPATIHYYIYIYMDI